MVDECLIDSYLMSYLARTAFGNNQWAFTKGLSCRDLVTMFMLSWILGICEGKKIGAWLSDISGAFDRVSKEYLLAKLQGYGVGPNFLNFLDAYLAPRTAQVVVQGKKSSDMEISDTVFQGTVLGPPLWNAFFGDVAFPAKSTGGQEELFADDLTVFQKFDRSLPVEDVKAKLDKCAKNVHKWGATNRVSFDPAKEHVVILHPTVGHGETFTLLGCMIDNDLRMRSCIEQLLSKIRPKITAYLI